MNNSTECTINAQYKRSRDRSKIEAQGALKGKTARRPKRTIRIELTQGGGSHDGQSGRLDCMSSGQGRSRKAKSQGGLPGLSPLRSDGSRGS